MLHLLAAAVAQSLDAPGVGEALSGVFGSVSLAAWICLLLPQLITNYKAKSADALSMKFLLIWLLGDVANLSGALITSLAPSAIALGSYFCLADLILISQCVYYNTINARRRAARLEHHHHHHHHHHRRRSSAPDDLDASASSAVADPSPAAPTETDPLLTHDYTKHDNDDNDNGTRPPGPHRRHSVRSRRGSSTGSVLLADPLSRIMTGEDDAPGSRAWLHNTLGLLAVWLVGVAGWFVSYKMGAWGGGGGGGGGAPVPGDDDADLVDEPAKVVGMVLGYASAVCYLCARIPQIIKNYREKSCEGLALLFFLLSLTGNLTYGASVIAYSQEKDYLIRALPWLLGSLGTVVEDCIIFVQFRIYAPDRQPKAAGTP